MRRIAIYFFYDADGIVDQYNRLILQDFSQYCDRLIVVCNGKLDAMGRKLFSKFTSDIIVRENKGFDVWAYKTAIEWIGWDVLRDYDELIMFNFTNFAPIYPFENVFEVMDQHDVDFWGISIHHRVDHAPIWFQGKYIPEHLQSHFIAVRRTMLSSYEFRAYWESRPPIESYESAVSRHEAIFTEHFANLGFRWRAFADTTVDSTGSVYPALNFPQQLLQKYHSPLLKRRLFFHPYQNILRGTLGYPARDAFRYIEEETDYPTDVIWENILRTCNQYDVYHTLHLNYILPTKMTTQSVMTAKRSSQAVILYLSKENCISRYAEYFKNFPKGTDFYLTCESEEVSWEGNLQQYIGKPINIEYAPVEQRARSVLLRLAQISAQYDYIAVIHFNGGITDTSRREAGYRCAESLMASEYYVKNVIQVFEENKRLGMLTIPNMYWGQYWSYYGKESQNYRQELKTFADLLHIPFMTNKGPISPYYGVFWCRGKAVQDVIQRCGEAELELLTTISNKGIYQFVDCVWGLLLQVAGYYCGYVMCDRLAELEYTNLAYQLAEVNRNFGCSTIWQLQERLKQFSLNQSCGSSGSSADHVSHNTEVDFASIPRSVMVKQTAKKFCPKILQSILERLFKKNES